MASSSSSSRRASRMKDNLPTPISADVLELIGSTDFLPQILKHLPAKPLFRFKRVCRTWRNLISSDAFLILWEPKTASSLYMCKYMSLASRRRSIEYYFIPLDDSCQSRRGLRAYVRSLAFIGEPVQILQSCNGLLLCGSTEVNGRDSPTCTYYICNPVTKQFITLPRPHGNSIGVICSMSLAVYLSHPFQFKVVAISVRSSPPTTFQIEIYSSEDRTWSFAGDTYQGAMNEINFTMVVFWNNAIHWPSYTLATAPYFDLNEQRFRSMPMPPVQGSFKCRVLSYFGVSNGHLNLVEDSGPASQGLTVLEMKNDYSEWFVKYQIDCSGLDLLEGVPRKGWSGVYFVSLVRAEIGESFVVFYFHGACYTYSLIKGTSKKLCNLPHGASDELSRWITISRHVHQHIDIPFWV